MLEKKLNELNIFALRDLARRTGVGSPTSKKKEELIKGIAEIMSGEKQPVVSKTKQGRPPKVFGYNFANVFDVNYQPAHIIPFNQKMEQMDEDLTAIAGWIEVMNNQSAILWVNRNLTNEHYFVPKEILQCGNIKNGDRIVAEASVDENQKIIKKIFSVNDCPIQQSQSGRLDYFEIEHGGQTRFLEWENKSFNNLKIGIGENVYFYGKDNNLNSTKIIELLQNCKIQNKIYINISITEKNKIMFSELNGVECFVAKITDDVDVVRRMILLAVERAKRIVETGEDCLLVVDDLLSIMGIDKDNLNLVKKIVSISKNGNPKGSITLFSVMPNHDLIQVEKLADQRIEIECK